MARRRRASSDFSIEKAILLLFIISYGSLASFWGRLSEQERLLFGILSVSALIVGIAIIVVFIKYRQNKRKLAWQQAMKSWNQNIGNGKAACFDTAKDLSPLALEKLAMQVYKKMGYKAFLTETSGDHGVDVRLQRPDGRTELVQCKQWNRPVGEPEVRDLMGALVHEKAAKGYLWAPNGFSSAAKRWSRGKPILLMDNEAIGKFVESVYMN